MAKKLLICPTCMKVGKRQILGEITNNGFYVKRFHMGTTVIVSNEMLVMCSQCGEKVFVRVRKTKI